MKLWFAKLSYTRKLWSVCFLAAIGIALVLAVVLVSQLWQTARIELQRDLEILARIVAQNSAPALAVNDPAAADAVINALSVNPEIMGADVFTSNGRRFAAYRRAGEDKPWLFADAFPEGDRKRIVLREHGDYFEIRAPIDAGGRSIGALQIRVSLDAARTTLWRVTGLVFVVTLGMSLIGALFLARALRRIRRPIEELARVTEKLSANQDYSQRVPVDKTSNDAIARLARSFNVVIEQVRRRDDDLSREMSNRARAEAALNEAQRIAKIGSWEWDPVSGTLLWSDEMFVMLGEQRESFVPTSESYLAHIHADDREQTLAAVRDAMRTGIRFSQDYRMLTRQGSIITVRSEGELVSANDAIRFIGSRLIGTTRDITALRETEAALSASETRFNAFMNAMPVSAWIKDAHGRHLYCNKEIIAAFGLQKDEWIGKTVFDVFDQDIAAGLHCSDMEVLRTGQSVAVIEKFVTSSGSPHYWHSVKFPFRGVSGQMLIGGIAMDVTEQKFSEKLIAGLAQRLRAIIDHAPVAVLECDPDSRVTLWSPTATQMFGLKAEEVLGMRLGSNGQDDDEECPQILADIYLPDLLDVCASGQLRQTERSVRLPNGLAELETHYVPMTDESGAVTKILAWTADITLRHHGEEALRQYSINLEKEVARRTAELEDLSNHLQKVAENERTLIARELHDELGGTLSSVKVAQGMLASSLAGIPGVPERLQQIQKMVDRALDATRHLIRQLRPPVLDHFGLVAALEWQAQEFSCSSGIPCHLQVADDALGGNLNLGEERTIALFRIFQEALTNIAKHAHATEVVASLEAVDCVIVLSIADNGTGLASNANAKGAGTGGFGIRGMIERARHLGGSLSLTYEPGKGTTAVARIPTTCRSRQIRILVADDDPVVRHGLRSFLESATDDMAVTGETADGEEAVGMALSGNFDVALMDISMPKLNGLRALGQIKARMFDLPVLIVSTHPADIYAPRVMRLGADGYVNKQEVLASLINEIRTALSKDLQTKTQVPGRRPEAPTTQTTQREVDQPLCATR